MVAVIKFLDFFSGAGMFRLGMEKAGHTCIGYVEIDKYARQTYECNFNTLNEWSAWDVVELKANQLPQADIWCAGFPCKNLSTANAITRFGLDGSQSGLFWKLCSLLEESQVKPKYLFLENVKGFATIRGGLDFLKALVKLHSLGYEIRYKIASALEFGVPQNRVRIYLVCKLSSQKKMCDNDDTLNFNKKTISADGINIYSLHKTLLKNSGQQIKIKWGDSGVIKNWKCKVSTSNKEIAHQTTSLDVVLEDVVDKKYYLSDNQIEKIKYMKGAKRKVLSDGRIWSEGAVPFPDSINKHARCITPSDGSLNRSTHIIHDGKGYRRLTIRERARLQGLPDNFVFPVSDNQASLQIGNGVVVNVIYQIAKTEII